MLELENLNLKTLEKTSKSLAKIIVVDDDVALSEVLVEILSQEGYQITNVQSGEAAIKKCQMQTFDVALVDIKLPDMEGTQLLELLKKLTPTTIFIVLTGYPSLDNAVRSLNSGADSYIIKPFKTPKLLEQIAMQLERRQLSKWENLLRNTGLSIYEAKIYLALTLKGPSEVRKLSMASGVPRTKAYNALKKLAQRGLIYEIPGAAQKFSVVEPSGAFTSFLANWKKDLSERSSILEEFENAIVVMASINANHKSLEQINLKKEDVWSIRGENEIKQRITEILSKAKDSVNTITTEEGLLFFYKNFGKELDALTEKGVKIQINVPVKSSNRSFVNDLRATYKIEDTYVSIPIFLVIVDDNEVFLQCLKKDNWETIFGLFCSSENLSLMFSKLFNFPQY